jgi:ubiquitin carboxyl-terminal hydrolase L3
MSPEERAVALEVDEQICRGHDNAAQEGQTAAPPRDESIDYHFIAFVELEGQLYELDGRKAGPLVVGPSSRQTFLKDAAAACQAYMSSDPDNINFTVLALTAAAAGD